jgi:hypothetical protein
MNKLAVVKIIMNGTNKTYTISKGQVNQETKELIIFEESQANVDDGESITRWQLVSGTYNLPPKIRE